MQHESTTAGPLGGTDPIAAAAREPGVALVAGSAGVIGAHAAAEYARVPGWRVRGAARREQTGTAWEPLRADLSDADGARADLAGAADTTHLVFAAYVERGDERQQIEDNTALLRNTLDALRDAPLRHVTLYQGGKAYGAHLPGFRTPARERDPRLLVPNFYYAQEDVLREEAARRGFGLTLLRPEGVVGYATGNPMNILMVVAVHAAISRELGLPLRFPGSHAAGEALYQVTDAELLARATVWAGSTAAADGEVFNVTNGDQFRWVHAYAAIARHLGMEHDEPQDFSLTSTMPMHEQTWQAMVQRHGLRPTPYADLVRWQFGDFLFHSEFDNVSSTVKVRRAGFGECLDSIDRFTGLLDRLAEQRVVPAG
ncbi:SDR family oxidoreductase [Kineococcus sp. SYSU DK006]|uniref:SDR family oxidoreductase n=1 Tax=Kineococcus sp. SYSU DK006 TaxID=3383127 RepID=UPI003D7DD92A